MAFGVLQFGAGPFGSVVPTFGPGGLPAEQPANLSSSRAIDWQRGDYVLDARGGYEPMDDVAQRVMMLVAFAAPKRPAIIDGPAMSREKARIREALSPLSNGRDRAIEVLAVDVTNPEPGVMRRSVTYRSLLTGTTNTVVR